MNIWPVVELDLICIPKTALLIVILSFSGCLLEAEKFITCYCNNHDKCENGRCRDESCLVGIDRSGKVVRTCYSLQPAELLLSKCSRWSGNWHEVCSCRYKHYCNSFAHFRRLFRTSALGVVHGDQQEIRGDSDRVLQVSTLYSPPAEVELDDFSLQSVQQPMAGTVHCGHAVLCFHFDHGTSPGCRCPFVCTLQRLRQKQQVWQSLNFEVENYFIK
ncbi:Linear gramicidin synthase subunit [Trichinella spiralis]|uniref:Linear gramicidin synthase subunit n=1 Tax=Trichinella spiralis TaxID=6334 RepID=A0ABR3KYA2_TRISP